jgi:predicted nucleic acid-binding protein
MKRSFADTCYWIAVLNPREKLHDAANRLPASLATERIYTSELVLTELLNRFSGRGAHIRKVAVQAVVSLMENPMGQRISADPFLVCRSGCVLPRSSGQELEPYRLFQLPDHASAWNRFRADRRPSL